MEFEEVYKLYFKDVYAFLYRLSQSKAVAEDITQDTFLKAMNSIHTFDGRTELKAWLFTANKLPSISNTRIHALIQNH